MTNQPTVVTPCMGVWIETLIAVGLRLRLLSHPVWVCGLKLNIEQMEDEAIKVTPCMGVWIETASMLHILWNGVSHPIWVCGLKHPR